MPVFCWFYSLTPWEYDELTLDQYIRMKKFLVEYHKPAKGR